MGVMDGIIYGCDLLVRSDIDMQSGISFQIMRHKGPWRERTSSNWSIYGIEDFYRSLGVKFSAVGLRRCVRDISLKAQAKVDRSSLVWSWSGAAIDVLLWES